MDIVHSTTDSGRGQHSSAG